MAVTAQAAGTYTTPAVLAAFKKAGLEVGKTYKMGPKDYGLGPYVGERGTRFLIPSLGEDAGGRVFEVKNTADRRRLRAYFDDLGKQSAIFFSWTFEKGNILVQINGDLPEAKALRYKKALEGLK